MRSKMILRQLGLLWMFLLLFLVSARAQPAVSDTLLLTKAQSEQQFLNKNLRLLAEALNIDQAQAKVIQARAWPNPVFWLDEVNVSATEKQLNGTDGLPPLFKNGFGRNQEFVIQLEQLVYTAGKRKKLIALEKVNVEIAETYLAEMLRNLKIEFRTLLVQQQYYQELLQVYNRQLESLSRLIASQTVQVQKGNLSKIELYRIRGMYNTLLSEKNSYQLEQNRILAELKTLLAVPASVALTILPDEQEQRLVSEKFLKDSLVFLLDETPELKQSRNQIKAGQAMYAYERAQRVPDINLRAGYDRGGNFLLNQVGVGIGFDLPVFNRNKGNIKAAGHALDQSKLLYEHTSLEVKNNLHKAQQDLALVYDYYKTLDTNYIEELDKMLESVIQNFERRNLSLLQFLDFFESYKENKTIYSDVVQSIQLKQEELNYIVGRDI
jgi:cobalt-zinc-cadmium efflux system outer membrane protein